MALSRSSLLLTTLLALLCGGAVATNYFSITACMYGGNVGGSTCLPGAMINNCAPSSFKVAGDGSCACYSTGCVRMTANGSTYTYTSYDATANCAGAVTTNVANIVPNGTCLAGSLGAASASPTSAAPQAAKAAISLLVAIATAGARAGTPPAHAASRREHATLEITSLTPPHAAML